MKSHQFTSMISFTGSTWPTLIISLSCLHTPSFLPPLSLSLSTSQTWSFTPLSPPTSSPLSHFNSPVQCALSFTVLARCPSFKPPSSLSFLLYLLSDSFLYSSVSSLVSGVVFRSFCCSVLHTGILRAHWGSQPIIDWDSRIEKLTTNGSEERQMQMAIYKLHVTGKQ